MRTLPDNSLILVAYMPARKDLDIARMLGWYRIPLKTAPKIIEVDFFAFFQGNQFGNAHHWQIEYLAEYKGNELTTRAELLRDEPDHPRAHEEYFKVQLGPLTRLETPVLAGSWKRITFLYTTGNLFNRARIVNDLVVQADEREVLWNRLRERAQNSLAYRAENDVVQELDPGLLEMVFGLNRILPEANLEDY